MLAFSEDYRIFHKYFALFGRIFDISHLRTYQDVSSRTPDISRHTDINFGPFPTPSTTIFRPLPSHRIFHPLPSNFRNRARITFIVVLIFDQQISTTYRHQFPTDSEAFRRILLIFNLLVHFSPLTIEFSTFCTFATHQAYRVAANKVFPSTDINIV